MISFTRAAIAAAVLSSVFATAAPALAATAAETLANCRLTVGRPVVQACIQHRLHSKGGEAEHHVAACRETASPAVKGCFQNAMKDVIMACRQSIGRPIVQACVRERIANEGGFVPEQFHECRKNAFGPVRACIWRTSEMKL